MSIDNLRNLHPFPHNFFRLETVYLIIYAFFCILLVFVVPPFNSPDEPYHFQRSYLLSEGEAFPQETPSLPKAINEYINLKDSSIPINPNNREILSDLGYASSPVMYLPQAIGISVARLFSNNVHVVFLAGRFSNVITWILCVALAIRFMPSHFQFAIKVYLFLPMLLFLSATLSYDVISNGVILIFFSFILHLSINYDSKILTPLKVIILLFLAFLIGQVGKANIFTSLLIFLLPESCFSHGVDRKKMIYWVIFTAVISFISWNLIINLIIGSSSNYTNPSGIQPLQQAVFIIRNPTNYVVTLLRSFYFQSGFYFRSFIGNFGWLNIPFPEYIYTAWGIALFGTTIISGDSKSVLKNKDRIIIGAIFLVNILLTFTTLYLIWSSYKAPIISGVQGRYLLASFPLLIYTLLFSIHIPNYARRVLRVAYTLFIVFSTLVTISLVATNNRFGVFPKTEIPANIPLGEITKDVTVSQTFAAECSKLDQVHILFATYARANSHPIQIQIISATSNEIISQTQIMPYQIKDNTWLTISFPSQYNSENGLFKIAISSPEGAQGNAFTIWMSAEDKYLSGELYVNNSRYSGDISFGYSCDSQDNFFTNKMNEFLRVVRAQ